MIEMTAIAPGLRGLEGGAPAPPTVSPERSLTLQSAASLTSPFLPPGHGSSHLFNETTGGQLNERILPGQVAPKEI